MSASAYGIVFALQYHGSRFMLRPGLVGFDPKSLGDVKLETIIDAYTNLHRGCPCGRSVGPRVWKVDIPWEQDVLAGLQDFDPDDTTSAQPLDPAASVHSVFGADATASVSIRLVISIEPMYPAIMYKGIARLKGDVCRVAGDLRVKSVPTKPDYSTFVAREGSVFVDKADIVRSLLGKGSDFRMPIIRRDSGYGKTAFLSLVAAWFRTSSPDMFCASRTCLLRGPCYPTLILDLATLAQELPVGQNGTHTDIMCACKTFVASSIERFYEENADMLGGNRPSSADEWMHSYRGLRALILELGTRLVVVFDNYTAPFERVSGMLRQDTEFEIWVQILGLVISDLGSVVWRGFMTGRPLGDILPFTNRPLFGERTRDITNDPDHVNVIGFSYDDVVHLGNALLGKSYDLAAAMKLGHNATEMTRTVYCARQVTSVLSELLNGSKLDDILADESLVPTSFSTSCTTDTGLSEQSSALQDTPHNFPSDSRLHMDAVKGPPNLPPEITLLIAEHAALRELHTERAWVASLCLVCWSFKRVVTPILYSSVTTRSDADARQIVALAQRPDNPLQYTRSVQLFQLGTTYTAGATDQIMRLGQALTNVSRFAGHDGAIDGLAHGNPTLRLSTIFITSTTDEWSECDDGALCPSRRLIQSAQRLHLVIDFSMEGVPIFPDWLHSCEAAYLIVDAFSIYESTESDELFTWFYEALEPFLRSRSLQRILLRPRYPGNTEAFSLGVVAWAERVRDSRICLDDSFVSPPGLEWMQFMDIDMDDVLVGDALWEHGQQVWRPS